MTPLPIHVPVASPALAPWQRRLDEPQRDFQAFVIWSFTRDEQGHRMAVPEAFRLASVRWDWDRRAAYLDKRLDPMRDLATVKQNIGLDVLEILSLNLEAKAAESRARPGSISMRDLTSLLSVVTALGGVHEIKPPEANADAEQVDYSQLTEAELETLAEASTILAKARTAPR